MLEGSLACPPCACTVLCDSVMTWLYPLVCKYHTGAGPVLLVRTRWLRVVNTRPHDIWGRAAVKTGQGSEACSPHDSTFICRTSVHPTFSKRV